MGETKWQASDRGFYRRVGEFRLSVTDRREGGDGWCWSASIDAPRLGENEELAAGGGFISEGSAKVVAEGYVRDLCERALRWL